MSLNEIKANVLKAEIAKQIEHSGLPSNYVAEVLDDLLKEHVKRAMADVRRGGFV